MIKKLLSWGCLAYLAVLPLLSKAELLITPYPFCELSAMDPGGRAVRKVSIFRFGRWHREKLGMSRVALLAAEHANTPERLDLYFYDLGDDPLLFHMGAHRLRVHTDEIRVVNLSREEAGQVLRELTPLGLADLELRAIREVSLPRGSRRLAPQELGRLGPGDALYFSNRYFVVTDRVRGGAVAEFVRSRSLSSEAFRDAQILRMVEIADVPRPGARRVGAQQELLVNSTGSPLLGRGALVPGPFYLLGRASFLDGEQVVSWSTIGESNISVNQAVIALEGFRIP